MKTFSSGFCPVCHGKLEISKLSCPDCKAEFPIHTQLSPYDYLSESQKEFLRIFLQSRGSLKAVGQELNLSYPTVKKRFDEVLMALGYMEKNEEPGEVQFDMRNFENMVFDTTRPSDIVKQMLYRCGGMVTIPQLEGKPCIIKVLPDGVSFTSDKLNNYAISYEYRVFDIIVDLLKESKNGTAPKGLARGKEDKVGYGKCTEDTVAGAIAIRYAKKNIGESTFDPVFILAAVLDWAGIAHNRRGYLELTAEYKALLEESKC